MNKPKKKRKGFNASSMRCPYCGSTVVYRSADGIYHENKKGTKRLTLKRNANVASLPLLFLMRKVR